MGIGGAEVESLQIKYMEGWVDSLGERKGKIAPFSFLQD